MTRLERRECHRPGLYWLAVLAVLIWPEQATAFKGKAHVAVANQAFLEVSPSQNLVWLHGIPSPVAVGNDAEVLAAARSYPAFYRAGALGPDAFPDLIAGQLWVHANRGRSGCTADGTGSPCIRSDEKLENRPINRWRSIDYAMYQLRRALQLAPGTPDRAQALAFAYGYLAHMLADAFAHAWVNEWTGDTWVFLEGSGTYGWVTEEVKHVAVETYLDSVIGAKDADLTIAAPLSFLNSIYLQPVSDATPGALYRTEVAGAYGGEYYEALISFRDLLAKLADHNQWADAVGPSAAPYVDALLQWEYEASHVGTFGTDILNPIADIEYYFARRRDMVSGLLTAWPQLSSCVSQNLLLGSNKAVDVIVASDACASTDFEALTGSAEIFKGGLNAAAWYGQGQNQFDYGRLSNNLRKMAKFVEVIAETFLRFSIIDDIGSVRRVLDTIGMCDHALIEWGGCANACNSVSATCSKIVETAACWMCPKRSGSYSCNPWYSWRRAYCYAYPYCFTCAQTNGFEVIVDPFCQEQVAKATVVCGLCTTSGPMGICASVELATGVAEVLPAAITEALQPVVDRAKAELKRRLLEAYAGPYASDFVAAFHEMERSWKRATPAWIVNVAFIADDLKADPTYLNRLISSIIGISGEFVDNVGAIGDAILYTTSRTASAAKPVLQAYLAVSNGITYEDVWQGIVTILYQAARDQNFNAVTALHDQAYAWLDSVTLTASPHHYETRLAKFLALMAELQRTSKIRGPTAMALRGELGLDSGPSDPTPPAQALMELHQIHVTHNSIEAVKLGFMHPSALDQLISARAGDAAVKRPADKTSTMCSLAPHVACDVLQSLDDPSNIRFAPPADYATSPNPELSLARWYTNRYQWSQGAVWQSSAGCKLGLSDFALAYTPQRISSIYDHVFRYPPSCPQPFPACTPTTCAAQGRTCGIISDGCNNGWLGCGACPSGQVCNPTGSCCTPRTCAGECGIIPDGCGGTLNCPACNPWGGCPSGYKCCEPGSTECYMCWPSRAYCP